MWLRGSLHRRSRAAASRLLEFLQFVNKVGDEKGWDVAYIVEAAGTTAILDGLDEHGS